MENDDLIHCAACACFSFDKPRHRPKTWRKPEAITTLCGRCRCPFEAPIGSVITELQDVAAPHWYYLRRAV